MATPNYGYEKRQKELAKKRKKEDKAARKANPQPGDPATDDEGAAPADARPDGNHLPPVQPVP